MGYETKLYVVQNNHIIQNDSEKTDPPKTTGYCNIMGMVELCKCGYEGPMSDFINEVYTVKDEDKEEYNRLVKLAQERTSLHNQIFTLEGDFAEGYHANHESLERFREIGIELEEKVPYAYIESDMYQTYLDKYGDLLRVVELKDVKEAMEKANEIEVYRRFDMAIALIEQTLKHCRPENTKAMLYGH
jgi:hypothetical protein